MSKVSRVSFPSGLLWVRFGAGRVSRGQGKSDYLKRTKYLLKSLYSVRLHLLRSVDLEVAVALQLHLSPRTKQ